MSLLTLLVFMALMWLIHSLNASYKSLVVEMKELRIRCTPSSSGKIEGLTGSLGAGIGGDRNLTRTTADAIRNGLQYLSSLA